MEQLMLQKYARLLVKMGINIQDNQILVVNSPIECAGFARMIAEVAYQEGAREVIMNWRDELSTKIKYLHAKEAVFDEFPEWQKEFYLSYARQGAAFLSFSLSFEPSSSFLHLNRLFDMSGRPLAPLLLAKLRTE